MSTDPDVERERCLDEAVLAYLKAREGNPQLDQQSWIEQYPDLKDDLANFFSDQNRIDKFADLLRLVTDAGETTANGDVTLGWDPADEASYVSNAPGLQVLGDYEILEEIGKGGMGRVYKARQRSLKRIVALKMILAGAHAGAEELKRFRSEAEAVARLQHPNIVQIFEVGELDGLPFFSLEFVDGGSLAAQLNGTPLPVRAAAELIRTLAEAVEFAHQNGIIHRDLKPANVLLSAKVDQQGAATKLAAAGSTMRSSGSVSSQRLPSAVAKITDFGLAKRLDDESGQTKSGTIMGTPSYMAPEQAAGQRQRIGPATDVYGLGAILYELLTGRPPFKAATPWETVHQVLHNEVASPRLLDAAIDRDVETICLKCLQKDPQRRYDSAQALADDLRRYLEGRPILARPIPGVVKFWRMCRRHPGTSTSLAFTLVALLVFFVTIVTFNGQLQHQLSQNEAINHELQMSLTRQVANRIDSDIRQLTRIPTLMATTLSHRPDWREDQLESWMQENLAKDERLFGTAVAFESLQFDGKRDDFCFYTYRGKERIKTKMLLTIIEKKRMPPDDEQPRPSEADLATIKAWIDAGAPDFNPIVAKREFVSSETILQHIFTDLRSLEEFDRQFARYFTLTHLYNAGLSDDQLQTYRLGLSRLTNSLSWGRRVVAPKAVDAAKTIFRIDLRDYRWKAETWDQILAANPFGITQDTQTAKACSTMTRSTLPYVRGDWFVFAASQPPLYHEVLEMPKTDRELEKLLQVDVAKNISQRRVARAGFNGSGVSQNNRLIERHELDLTNGAYWKSYDFGGNTGKQNLFERPLGFQHDGGENIFNLPNGLQAYMLVDAKGVRIDKGPTAIVSDPKRPDRAVINGLSCMSCHNQGMIEKEDQVRKHVEANRAAFGRDETDIILGIYPGAAKMKNYFKEDAERFAKAVEKTGQKLDGNGRIAGTDPAVILAALFEQELDLNLAAAEAGVAPDILLKMLSRDSSMARSLGPVRNKGGTVKREVYVAIFGDLVRDLELGQFVAPKNGIPIEQAKEVPLPKVIEVPLPKVKEVPLPRPIPAIFAQDYTVKQRTTVVLNGADGAIKVRVADIKRGKTADVEIIGPNSLILASRKNAQVGDRIPFVHAGRAYEAEVVRYRNLSFGTDVAQIRINLR